MSDIGIEVVQHIYDKMQVDEEWSTREERGFIWWAEFLPQVIWADPCVESDGVTVCRVHARTDLLRDFDGSSEHIRALRAISGYATVSGAMRAPEDPTSVQLTSSVYVHQGTVDWLKELMAVIAPLQVGEAHAMAIDVAKVTGAEVAASSPGDSGMRPEPDGMLGLLERVVIPEGQQASLWRGADMIETARALQALPQCMSASGDAGYLTAMFPFQGETSLLEANSIEAHPQLGSGVRLQLTLPIHDSTGWDWLELNELEMSTDPLCHTLGSWCPGPHGLTFVSFYPNALHRQGSLSNVAVSMARRAVWAEGLFTRD